MKLHWIRHRVNRIKELSGLEKTWGAEIDLRAGQKSGEIYLAHDPWAEGDDFGGWLDEFVRLGLEGPIALNTKEDGLESRIYEQLAAHKLNQFFFVDTPLPTLVRWTQREKRNQFSVRLSEFEPIEGLEKFKSRADWVWVDCFGARALDLATVKAAAANFKICLVSPELQGGSVKELTPFSSLVPLAQAVCTKDPQAWKTAFALG